MTNGIRRNIGQHDDHLVPALAVLGGPLADGECIQGPQRARCSTADRLGDEPGRRLGVRSSGDGAAAVE